MSSEKSCLGCEHFLSGSTLCKECREGKNNYEKYKYTNLDNIKKLSWHEIAVHLKNEFKVPQEVDVIEKFLTIKYKKGYTIDDFANEIKSKDSIDEF